MWSWPLTPWPQQSIEVIFWPTAMHLWSLKVQLLIGNCFGLQGQCYLNLWPFDPKINRGNLLTKTIDASMQFEGQGPIGCQVIDWKPFLPTRSRWPWTLTPWPKNQKGSFTGQDQRTYELWRPRVYGLSSSKNWFYLQGKYDIYLRSLDPKIDKGHLFAKTNAPTNFEGQQSMGCHVIDGKLGVIYWSWTIPISSLKFLGLRVL
jgi:hypothetical protein